MIKWIKDKIIYFLIGGVCLAGTVAVLPENELTKAELIERDLPTLENTIKTDLQANGKYKRQDPQTIKGVEYEVHEYETSKGEIGYTVFMTKEEDNKIYKKAISTGVQKEDREFDWVMVQDNTIYEVELEVATTTK